MGKGEVATIFNLSRERHGFIDARQGALQTQRLGLEFREQPGIVVPRPVMDAVRQRATKLFRPGCGVMKTAARPSRAESRVGAPEGQPMLPAKII